MEIRIATRTGTVRDHRERINKVLLYLQENLKTEIHIPLA